MMQMTREMAIKVRDVVDAGLCSGLGEPELGHMCVEAAVNYAQGKPHGDEPDCVAPALRAYKIKLNDAKWSSKYSRAKGMRRLAILQLGTRDHIMPDGSLYVFDEKFFAEKMIDIAIRISVPFALRAAAKIHPDKIHRDELEAAATRCANEGTKDSAVNAAHAATYAAYAAHAAAHAAAYATYAAHAATYAAYAAHAAAYATYATYATYAAHAATYAAYAAHAADQFLSHIAEETCKILIAMNVPAIAWLDLVPLDDGKPSDVMQSDE